MALEPAFLMGDIFLIQVSTPFSYRLRRCWRQRGNSKNQIQSEKRLFTRSFLCEFDAVLRIRLQQNLMTMIVLLHLKVLQMLPTRKCHKFYQNSVSTRKRLVKETNDYQAPVKELHVFYKNLTVGSTTKLLVKSEVYSVNETRLLREQRKPNHVEHTVRLIDASSTRQI